MANWLAFTRAHCAVYRGTRGLIGGNLIGMHMLLLTTRGRKTGKRRTLPLAYVEYKGELVVVASNGGAVPDGVAYFANSYALPAQPSPGWQLANCRHGVDFVAAAQRGAVLLCQFHPELSGRYGADLLRGWLQSATREEVAPC